MNLELRYTPNALKMGFEEFGDKYFRKLSEINYYQENIPRLKRIYPMAWDNYQDRDLVWTAKPYMITDYIDGVKRHCTNNPVNIIILRDNIKSLSKTEITKEQYKKDIHYFHRKK